MQSYLSLQQYFKTFSKSQLNEEFFTCFRKHTAKYFKYLKKHCLSNFCLIWSQLIMSDKKILPDWGMDGTTCSMQKIDILSF